MTTDGPAPNSPMPYDSGRRPPTVKDVGAGAATDVEPSADDREVGPPAEVMVQQDTVHVTLEATNIPEDRAEHFVGSNVLIVWDRERPEDARSVVQIPVDIDPQTAIVRINRNVLDLTARRIADGASGKEAGPTRASSDPSHPPDSSHQPHQGAQE